ncbi:MAG: tetratricopeptide repeat protein, partial [Nitrospinota bacterium]
ACLGKAYAEAGEVARAVPTLEQAVELADRVRSRQLRARFRAMLGEAYLLDGQMDKARDVAGRALASSTDLKYVFGIGLSHQVLGRVAQAQGALGEAERHLNDALQAFDSIRARFETGRTHLDLAALAHAQGNREAIATHLKEAYDLFTALRVPKYVERTEELAKQFSLPPVTG